MDSVKESDLNTESMIKVKWRRNQGCTVVRRRSLGKQAILIGLRGGKIHSHRTLDARMRCFSFSVLPGNSHSKQSATLMAAVDNTRSAFYCNFIFSYLKVAIILGNRQIPCFVCMANAWNLVIEKGMSAYDLATVDFISNFLSLPAKLKHTL